MTVRLVSCWIFSGWAAMGFAGAAPKPVGTDAGSTPGNVAAAVELEADTPSAEPKFDTTAQPLPPDLPGLNFSTTGTAEFGDLLRLEGLGHYVESVTATLSTRAVRSDYPGAAALGFVHPITLNVYAVAWSDGQPRPGVLLATSTKSFLIPWRAEPDPTAPASQFRWWQATDGGRYAGLAFSVSFDLSESTTPWPGEVIVTLAFDTQHHGAHPRGMPGPYDHLRVAVTPERSRAGSDVEADAVFWKTSTSSNYSDRGAGGVNVLRRDTGWTPYKPVLRINHSPYGALYTAASRLARATAAEPDAALVLNEAAALCAYALDPLLWAGQNRLQPASGRLVFETLGEATSLLAEIARGPESAAVGARAALSVLTRTATTLAELAISDAVLGRGDGARTLQACDALDRALVAEAAGEFAAAFDALGLAWRAAAAALP